MWVRSKGSRVISNLSLAITTGVLVLALASVGHAQSSEPAGTPSLGDLARKQREKLAKDKDKDKDGKPKKVLTNEDLPPAPEASGSSAVTEASTEPGADANVAPAGAVLQDGEHWKAAITQQKAALADLKSHMEKLKDSIHFVEANAYRNGVEYNKIQAHKQEELQRLQSQFDEQQKNLEKMQESARKAGFGSAVWDP